MDLGYGILGMGDDEKKADALWEEAAAYCQKMAVSGLEAPYQAGYMYLGGTTEVLCIRHSGRQLPAFHSVHRKWYW